MKKPCYSCFYRSLKEAWSAHRLRNKWWSRPTGFIVLLAVFWWLGFLGEEKLLSLLVFSVALGDEGPSKKDRPSVGGIFKTIEEIVNRMREIEHRVDEGEADEFELWQEWANLPTWLTEASPKVQQIAEDARSLIEEAQFIPGGEPPMPQPRYFPNIGALLQWMTEMKLFFEVARLSQEIDSAVMRARKKVPYSEVVQGEAIVDRQRWRVVGEIELPEPYGKGVPSILYIPHDPTDPFGKRSLWIKIPVEIRGLKGAPSLPLPGRE